MKTNMISAIKAWLDRPDHAGYGPEPTTRLGKTDHFGVVNDPSGPSAMGWMLVFSLPLRTPRRGRKG
jgi:hypothetical protein